MHRHVHPRLVAVLVVSGVMLISGVASSYTLFRCTFDAQARRACCCPATSHAPPSTPQLRSAGCCDPESVDVVQPPAESMAALTLTVAPPSSATFVPTVRLLVPARVDEIERPGLSPPLIVLKQSFLI